MGFEPTTNGTTIRCSTAELQPPDYTDILRTNYSQGKFSKAKIFKIAQLKSVS